MARIVRPTVAAMAAEGMPYRGVLYAGLMIDGEGPKLLEYNIRFGDPECQVLLPRLKSDLLPALLAARDGVLDHVDLRWSGRSGAVRGDGGARLSRRLRQGEAASPASRRWTASRACSPSMPAPGATAAPSSPTADASSGSRRSAPMSARPRPPAYEAVARVDWPEGFCRGDIGWRAVAREGRGRWALAPAGASNASPARCRCRAGARHRSRRAPRLSRAAPRGLSAARSRSSSSAAARAIPPTGSAPPPAATWCAASRRESCCPRRMPSSASTGVLAALQGTGVPAPRVYAPVRGRRHHRHALLRHGACRGPGPLGAVAARSRARVPRRGLRRHERRHRQAARPRTTAASASGISAGPAAMSPARSPRWSRQYRASETETIAGDGPASSNGLPAHLPDDDETALVHGDYRLDNLIFAHDRPRLLAILDWGDIDPRPPPSPTSPTTACPGACRLRPGAASTASTWRRSASPPRRRISPPIAGAPAATGRSTGSSTWPTTCGGWRPILQGIMGRVVDGTAASEHAAEMGGHGPHPGRVRLGPGAGDRRPGGGSLIRDSDQLCFLSSSLATVSRCTASGPVDDA